MATNPEQPRRRLSILFTECRLLVAAECASGIESGGVDQAESTQLAPYSKAACSNIPGAINAIAV
ncbi:hypothetical protein [Streptomyces sp. NPDC051219]|uniref:hypothetical protein n=1 Tax=Streptomyces sp. NPDC051219 TaxID=3155283 RepID=UPI0034341D20